MGSDRSATESTEGHSGEAACEETRRSLLTKAGVVAGAAGLATVARPDDALAHRQSPAPPSDGAVALNFYDVTAHGADPSGGTSSAAAFNSAISEASGAGGGTVFVSAGTYVFSAAIKLKSNVTLLGFGRPVIKPHSSRPPEGRLLQMTSFAAGTNNYAQTDVTISGLVFDGDNWPNVGNALVPLFSCDNLRVINCEFRNYGGSLVYIAGCRNVTLRGLKFRNWNTFESSQKGGGALAFGGNHIGYPQHGVDPPDATPCSVVRASNLDFRDGNWHGMQIECRDFLIENVTMENVKEAGVYSTGYNGAGSEYRPSWSHARDGILSNFRIKGVRRRDIASCAFEMGGHNVAVRKFVVSDCEQCGIQVNWPAEHMTVEDGEIYDTLKRKTITNATWSGGVATFTTSTPHGFQNGTKIVVEGVSPSGYNGGGNGSFVVSNSTTYTFQVPISTNPGTYSSGGTTIYWAWPNYGQVTILQRNWDQMAGIPGIPPPSADADTSVNNVTIRNVSIGKRGVSTQAKYAVRADGVSGQFMNNVVLNGIDPRYGFSLKPISFSPSGVAPSAAPANDDYCVRKIYSDTDSVEWSAHTQADGKDAGLDLRGRTSSGASVRARLIARGPAGDVRVGAVSDHPVVFERNQAEMFRFNDSGHIQTASGRNLGIGTTSFGGGTEVVGFGNVGTSPSANPSGGGVLFVEGGALKWRGPNGTVTTIAPA